VSGYSGTPLPKKLGIKDGYAVLFVDPPEDWDRALGPLPDVRIGTKGAVDVIVLFVTRRADFEKKLPSLRKRMSPAAGLWIAWPKRASKVPTDMTEDVVRDVALPTGLVDNKVCAIDEVWSGLRLVIRRELR
jgi:hypothetical protein